MTLCKYNETSKKLLKLFQIWHGLFYIMMVRPMTMIILDGAYERVIAPDVTIVLM